MDRFEAEEKNMELVEQLECARDEFCDGLGTRHTKLMLNKLGKTNRLAVLFRKALETEDCNIMAKRYFGSYRRDYYEKKGELLDELTELCDELNVTYGISKTDNYSTSHIIYFELPNCQQISFHFNPSKASSYPKYNKPWDGKVNSTMWKLDEAILKNFPNEVKAALEKKKNNELKKKKLQTP